MFHRRLRLLSVVMAIVFLLLAAQMSRLAIVQGAQHLDTAEGRLDLVRYLPSTQLTTSSQRYVW